ncbi:MAG TPA: hypothetical protein VMV44_09765 [Rectinemataceae bacterium]|nr:hypothetical protein [Rectinemataceae bacterium]
MGTVLRSVGVGIPGRRMSNDELALRIDTSDEWIRSHTGMGSQHYAEDSVLTSDLAVAAAREALAKAGVGAGADSLKLVQSERTRTFERDEPRVPYLYMDGRSV